MTASAELPSLCLCGSQVRILYSPLNEGAEPRALLLVCGHHPKSRCAFRLPIEQPAARPQFTCPVCGASSSHPDDLKNGYCGRCHQFTAEPVPDAGIEGLFADLIRETAERQQEKR